MITFSKLLGSAVTEGFDLAANNAAFAGGVYAPLWGAIANALEDAQTSKGKNFIRVPVTERAGVVQTPKISAVQAFCAAWFQTPNLDYAKPKALKISEALVGLTNMVNQAYTAKGKVAPFPVYGCPVFCYVPEQAPITEADVIAASAKIEAKNAAKKAAKNAKAVDATIALLVGMTEGQVQALLQACAARLQLDIVGLTDAPAPAPAPAPRPRRAKPAPAPAPQAEPALV